jgi:hypothetical protein
MGVYFLSSYIGSVSVNLLVFKLGKNSLIDLNYAVFEHNRINKIYNMSKIRCAYLYIM